MQLTGTGMDHADDAFRRMSGIASVGFGALVAVLAAATGPVPPVFAVLGGVCVALLTWIVLTAVLVLGPMDARGRAAAAARQNQANERGETRNAGPADEDHAASMPPASRDGTPADPLPVTRTEAPAKRLRKGGTAKPAAPFVAKPEPGIAGGLDAAVARSHSAAPLASAGPERLRQPRGGRADDLKLIRGIGPKLERLLNEVGIWHYDQIAAWKARDIADVDAQLGSFRGRITRDAWVKQARILVTNGVDGVRTSGGGR